jgi:hypothetical protein
MGRFLDRFPKVRYDIDGLKLKNYDSVTDLTFRFSVIKDAIKSISSYYDYVIRDGETPEMLADRVYNDPEGYWVILYANDIYDPQYDWPLDSNAFKRYIIGKYGSTQAAKSNIHHYEKLITRQIGNTGSSTMLRQTVDYNASSYLACTLDNVNANVISFIIPGQKLVQKNPAANTSNIFEGFVTSISNNTINLSIDKGKVTNYINLSDVTLSMNTVGRVIENTHNNLEFYLNLPQSPQTTSYVINNKRITETVERTAVSFYDYEYEKNENKRFIKIIKKEYYSQIQSEFKALTGTEPAFIRRLV